MLEVKRKPASYSKGTGTAPARAQQNTSAVPAKPSNAARLTANEPQRFLSKVPVIVGEFHFRGSMSIDGLLSGQLGTQSGLNLKQRPSAAFATEAELSGDFNFKDTVRVNGHIAGKVYSKSGTIIVDTEARVDAQVDVAVAVIGGTVRGDIVARERVELGPASRIYGNIWTRSIVIKDGAIFEGVCRMIAEEQLAG